MKTIPQSEWKWYGKAAHFILGEWCRFHLATQIGDHIISTVGELFPDAPVRELYAEMRGKPLVGKGDARVADYMIKFGYEEIGYKRKYETLVFRVTGEVCTAEGCDCGLPEIVASELDGDSYNNAGDATRGHMAMCQKWSTPELAIAEREAEVGTA